MAAQDVRGLVPRVRRAVEGPLGVATQSLSDAQCEALAADCIADMILLTEGQWEHRLLYSELDGNGAPLHWQVDPGLEPQEESAVAAQAAITFFFHQFHDRKTSETIRNEGVEWTWQTSGAVVRDHIKALMDMRNAAIAALKSEHPSLVRYESFLAVRDPVMSAVLEPYVYGGGLGGGQLLCP